MTHNKHKEYGSQALSDLYAIALMYEEYINDVRPGLYMCKEDSIVWASKQGLINDDEAALFYSIL